MKHQISAPHAAKLLIQFRRIRNITTIKLTNQWIFVWADGRCQNPNKGYTIPSARKKPDQQFISPCHIVKRIGRFAYQLAVSDSWRIHPVCTIAQLEPCPPPTADLFGRARPEMETPRQCMSRTTQGIGSHINCTEFSRSVRLPEVRARLLNIL